MSKEPQLDLAATVIEGKETGRRSAGILLGGTPAIGQANKAAVMVEDHKHGTSKWENCKCCGRLKLGISPYLEARKKNCPAWKKESSNCYKEGHSQTVCRGKNRKEKISGDSNKVWPVKWTTMW